MKAIERLPLFYFLKPAAVIPFSLNLRNIFLLPTAYGLVYLTLLVGMLVGSVNYNNNLGFLLTFLLGSLGIMGGIHTYRMLYGLQVESATADTVFAGESLTVKLNIGAAGRGRVGLCWYFTPENRVIVDVSPDREIGVSVYAMTQQRGIFDPGRLTISCTYPLGLFRAWARIDPNLKCLVYPRPKSHPLTGVQSLASGGKGDQGQVAGVEDFEGLSPYQAGDSPQRIHWPAFSRGQGLYSKQFSAPSEAALMLDMKAIEGSDIERKISILCFWVLTAYQEKRNFGLMLDQQHIIPVGEGRGHRDRCLRELALYGAH